MVGWHHRLNGHEFEWTPGVSDGQGGLACCRPWGHKELGMTKAIEHALVSVHFSSLSQSRPTLCEPMDCSTPGFPVLHHLPEHAQTHAH